MSNDSGGGGGINARCEESKQCLCTFLSSLITCMSDLTSDRHQFSSLIKMGSNDTDLYLYNPALLDEIKLTDWPKSTFSDTVTVTAPGEGLHTRPLRRDDYEKGFPAILSQLTAVGDVTQKDFQNSFDRMRESANTYYVTVIEDVNKGVVIGSATLLLEQKFIHDCAKRGRIEDVVVDDQYRGKHLGKILLTTLVALCKHLDCYKISLDCRDQMIPFYETLGFVKEPNNGNFMVIRY